MQRVLVLSQNKQCLMPCHPARARALLKHQRARIFRANPFTIILIDRIEGVTQHAELKLDPGSKTTGVAYVVDCQQGRSVFFAAHLSHRGEEIKQSLAQGRAIRRARRARKTRYRQPRFNNRTRTAGWLPPSLISRVNNIAHFVKKVQQLVPIAEIAVETVRFDSHKLTHPEVTGILYQQGTLQGFEVREYLLEKWQRRCAYCDASQTALEVEHIVPRAMGGTNRVSNLTLACHTCNQRKGAQPIADFLKSKPQRLKAILAQTKTPLKDAAAVNATRYRIGEELKKLRLPITFWTGGRTKFNRTQQKYPKDHWIDAACVGEKGQCVFIPSTLRPLIVKACGRGSRQMCRVDRFGFPRTRSKQKKVIFGFKTGDLVKVIVTQGKKAGTYLGRVAVRASGNFNVKTHAGTVQGINYRYCRLVQSSDGYHYLGAGVSSSC
jgi:5-methylcytosine-specific restriction endonuclease McrA